MLVVLTNIKGETLADSDFDDDAPNPKRSKPSTKPSTKPKPKPKPRLQFAGQRDADKCIMNARDSVGAHVIVVTLDWRKADYAAAQQVLTCRDCTGRFDYEINENCTQVGHDEFLGFFFTDAAGNPGVGKIIAELLLESEDNHVVVVDGTRKGEEYARLAALAAAHFYKLLPGGNGELWKAVRKFPTRAGKPAFPHWKAVVDRMARCKSEVLLRAAMKDHYAEHLAQLL